MELGVKVDILTDSVIYGHTLKTCDYKIHHGQNLECWSHFSQLKFD